MSDATEQPTGPKPIVHEVASALSPYIRRIVADNPGFMTGPGTNTYLVGIDEIAVIDPGPDTDVHLEAIAGCGGDRIRWILLTHLHPDHAPGAARLSEMTGAPIWGFDAPKVHGLESWTDVTFDRALVDGDTVEATEFRLAAMHTPGHASNHLCFLLEEERTLFTGDHIMEGSTVVIAPPDGDMAVYLQQLERIRRLRLKALAPGHGHLITEPRAKIDEYLTHRREREEQVFAAVQEGGPQSIDDLVKTVYADLPDERRPVAILTAWAHLLKLAAEGRVQGTTLAVDAQWSVA